jgi:hypothetical protein
MMTENRNGADRSTNGRPLGGGANMNSATAEQAATDASASRQADVVSAMPFLHRDTDSVWTRALDLRDSIYKAIESTCRDSGIVTLINKSIDFAYPAWVSLEAWLPADAPGATYRIFSTFQIAPKPHSIYEFEVTIRHERDGRKKSYGPFRPLADADVADWTKFFLDKVGKPASRKLRLRAHAWQFWYPKNKVTGLSLDALSIGSGVLIVIGVLACFAAPVIGFLAILLGLALLFYVWRRRRITVNAGRPIAEPRTLRLADSWSTMANQLGQEAQILSDRLFKRLSEGQTWNIQARIENTSYITPDGKQERQQLVLSQGRGLVFCHIYPYGDDLFIGWDAYLNYGQWAERAVRSGFDAKLRSPVVINTVTPGIARATEYDLIDVSSLTEWVHSRVVQALKQVMAEHKLDQEIDFKIVRGERQSLLRDQGQSGRRPLFSRANPAEEVRTS